MTRKYRANAKLMLTGEYLILHGAKSLSFPLNYNQELVVSLSSNPKDSHVLLWQSLDQNGQWLFVHIDKKNLDILETNSLAEAQLLSEILKLASESSPKAIKQIQEAALVKTQMNFDRNWGLGSSSTLLSLIGQWTEANPYYILEKTFGGSGYDIACAQAKQPIYYTLKPERIVENCAWNPNYKEQLWFVYSGKKQSSKNSVSQHKHKIPSDDVIARITEISVQIPSCQYHEFESLMIEHEKIVSEFLGIPTLKSEKFAKFNGFVKSLGAWGGDFFLVGSTMDSYYVKNYFALQGLNIVIPFEEMVMLN